MKAAFAPILAGVLCAMSFGSDRGNGPGSLYRFENEKGECGYRSAKGKTVIPPGKYPMCWSDTIRDFAIVSKSRRGIVGIDRKGKELFQVFVFDNGPDYPSEGVFRILREDKIGFADTTGKIVIEPKYTAVAPFQGGLAAFCDSCKRVQDGEHWAWEGGKWGFMDKNQKVRIEPRYDSVSGFEDGACQVELNGVRFAIDSSGSKIN
jgi:hypothetical protein